VRRTRVRIVAWLTRFHTASTRSRRLRRQYVHSDYLLARLPHQYHGDRNTEADSARRTSLPGCPGIRTAGAFPPGHYGTRWCPGRALPSRVVDAQLPFCMPAVVGLHRICSCHSAGIKPPRGPRWQGQVPCTGTTCQPLAASVAPDRLSSCARFERQRLERRMVWARHNGRRSRRQAACTSCDIAQAAVHRAQSARNGVP